ncbi:hypothetical protein [uncultured Muribaculum sp.]|nr:hypothetical protein [uncultured Muribaculum sp.]
MITNLMNFQHLPKSFCHPRHTLNLHLPSMLAGQSIIYNNDTH